MPTHSRTRPQAREATNMTAQRLTRPQRAILFLKVAAFEIFHHYNTFRCAVHGHPYTQSVSIYLTDDATATKFASCDCGQRTMGSLS
jgi:hypothetical protein